MFLILSVATLLLSFCWTSQQRSTGSTMRYFSNASGPPSVWIVLRWPGFHPTWPVSNNTSAVGARPRPLWTSSVECRKDRSSDLSFSSSTQLTSLRSSLTADCHCTSTPTIARFMALVCLPPSPVCRPTFRKLLMTYPAGCDPIVYSLTLRKQK